ncbi:hypothetical protein N825_12010 [Skermanella stibiiresistens SB22]|uniref:Restriction system protein Mrr-like N-terminal domain-containing protein n=1 Tax=Skermanella stibiiresistens SB22 TaxID=1385369 RepID=W9H441_9PROT|nr:hypothetical protein [Skermanella stibiiresistens]EWY38528.1 hypothetical protein N825_12010 [Skermanella stibiiresistens SB22]
MDLTDYPLLHEADMMLTLLRVAAKGPATLDDALDRLKTNLASVGGTFPVTDAEILPHLSRMREHLIAALLLEEFEHGRVAITPRGERALAEHPSGIDDSVLMAYPEFRDFIKARAGHPMKTVGDKNPPGDDPRPVEFDQGFVAFREGLDINDNPHSRDTSMHIAWENGWSEAKDDVTRLDAWAAGSTNI